jgi:hypothetical protein
MANPQKVSESTRPVAAFHQGDRWVMTAADRRSWGILRTHFSARDRKNRKRPVEAAGAVDAENAPTAPWKTG